MICSRLGAWIPLKTFNPIFDIFVIYFGMVLLSLDLLPHRVNTFIIQNLKIS